MKKNKKEKETFKDDERKNIAKIMKSNENTVKSHLLRAKSPYYLLMNDV